ncbi:DNA-binding NtrC family response regulator [Archangium gephyra]|uniref:DNA-binding NtrC family response regulator n=1 Tax=Archangium gephyra TaxID=48 RepID=A0AAC8THD0_9BACT|nr:sigma-54-dependent Fis family transcriptional regulator [Archangium gephyra]AKJ05730.1 Response regulator of zinc sigma-54-dependent two-component system [Archangium gephyra]REG36410.1 DNA-binding NtrC family response regulator [Archangium gephyra]
MPELVFFRRGEEVLRVGVGRERMVLGRGEKSDVVLPDPEVSRQQVALVFDGQRCTMEDLSGKGTQVAGASMKKGELADGADITLGQWRAVFRLHGSGQSDAATEVGDRTELQPRDSASRWHPAQVRIRQGGNETVQKLTGDSFTVGKDPSCDLVIQDSFISSRHLKVTRRDGHFHVLDTNSTNGTWMGPVRIFEVQVGLPTTLRLGQTDLVLEPVTPARRELSFHGIIGADPSVKQLVDLIERVAPSSAAVAILGESGTGKELVARALHECSQRADKPFIPVNCAAISKELIESELFGHEKGSFTGATNARKGAFEEADGGTLFLDEIGELPVDLQAKLLRALENGEIKRVGASKPSNVDVRVVAATNRDLLAASRDGRFREDLYYRLCVVPLHLPPLRNRRSDILGLAEHFLRMYSPRGQTVRLSPAAMERLQQHGWPGNIRELRNVVHRALLLRKGDAIDAPDITFDQEVNRETGVSVPELPPGMTLEQMLLKLERQIVEAALRRCNNNRERVARELGVARSTLFKRLKEWGLTRQEEETE